MTEHNLKHNYINNITHILLQFLVSWEFVGYIRTHILDIPYTYSNGHSYNFIATIALVVYLYFFLYKKKPPKVELPILFIATILSSLNVVFIGQLIFNLLLYNVSREAAEQAAPYLYVLFIGPMITYLLAFINRKAFFVYMAINIIGFFAYFHIRKF